MGFSRSIRNLNSAVMYEHHFHGLSNPQAVSELLIFTVSRVESCSQSLNVNPGFYKCKVTALRDTNFNFKVT